MFYACLDNLPRKLKKWGMKGRGGKKQDIDIYKENILAQYFLGKKGIQKTKKNKQKHFSTFAHFLFFIPQIPFETGTISVLKCSKMGSHRKFKTTKLGYLAKGG